MRDLPRDAARHEELRQFGNDLNPREQSRDEMGLYVDGLLTSQFPVSRRILHEPLLAAAAVLTGALGVRANTAIVSVPKPAVEPAGMRDEGRVMAATVRPDRLQMRKCRCPRSNFANCNLWRMRSHRWPLRKPGLDFRDEWRARSNVGNGRYPGLLSSVRAGSGGRTLLRY